MHPNVSPIALELVALLSAARRGTHTKDCEESFYGWHASSRFASNQAMRLSTQPFR